MYTESSIDNKAGWSCSWCNKRAEVDMVYLGSLDKPFTCTTCLVDALKNNTLSIIVPSDDGELPTSCTDCMETLAAGESRYCQTCYDAAYEAGENDSANNCDYCGDDSSVYCIQHAKENWDLVEMGNGDLCCDECGTDDSSDSFQYLCEACLAKVSVPDVTYAQAAEPIEVSWGDD